MKSTPTITVEDPVCPRTFDKEMARAAAHDLPLMFDANLEVSDLFRGLFIFEMANNHQGSLEHGLRIIRAMSDIARKWQLRAGVKLQYRDLDTFIHPDFRDRIAIPWPPNRLSPGWLPRVRARLPAGEVAASKCRRKSHGLCVR